MALNQIGILERELAEEEAKGVGGSLFGVDLGTSAEREELVGGVAQAAQQGIQTQANMAQTRETGRLDVEKREKQKKWEGLLASGVDGVSAFAVESGIDAAPFVNMAKMATTPKEFTSILDLINKAKEKNAGIAASQLVETEQASLFDKLESLGDIEQDDTFEKDFNEAKRFVAGFTSPASRKEGQATLKGMLENRDKKIASKGTKLGLLKTELDITGKEFDRFQRSSSKYKKFRKAVGNIEVAVAQIVEADARNDRTPNLVLDNVLGVAFQKLLDEESVVRESEFARLGAGQGFMENIQGKIDQAINSGLGFTPETRAQVVEFMTKVSKLRRMLFVQSEMMTMANRANFDSRFLGKVDNAAFSDENMILLKGLRDKDPAVTKEFDDIRKSITESVKAFQKDPKSFFNQPGDDAPTTTGTDKKVINIPSDIDLTKEAPIEEGAISIGSNGKPQIVGRFKVREK